jgi:GGDEF domain-containing protein
MSAVQRTMHREDRGGSGHRTEEPWAFERLPRRRRLRAYLVAVTATEFLLAAWQLPRGATVTVTVSIGVAALGVDGEDLFEMLAAADAALYRAKKSGRDRVCTLPPGAGPSDPLR